MVGVRFKRVEEAFGNGNRLCESSSGSDHSPSTDLSDLVNSFLERGIIGNTSTSQVEESVEEEDAESMESRSMSSKNNPCTQYYQTTKNGSLKGIFVNSCEEEYRILTAVDKALVEVGNFLSPDFNRRLMARLRYRGFDAGLCKSKWEKTGSCPSGYHEYIDVMLAGNRYIVEVSLAKEFQIARPTPCYEELLNHFPQIFVGKPQQLKQIVKVMCKSMKKSLKKMEMAIPPWRRKSYVNAKWFTSYKRTTNEFPTSTHVLQNDGDELITRRRKKSIGFLPPALISSPPLMLTHRQGGIGTAVNHNGFKMGNLAAALQDTTTALLL